MINIEKNQNLCVAQFYGYTVEQYIRETSTLWIAVWNFADREITEWQRQDFFSF